MSRRFCSYRVAICATCALLALASLPGLAQMLDRDSKMLPDAGSSRDQAPFLLIKQPSDGAIEIKKVVRIVVELSDEAQAKTLRLALNGKDITKNIELHSCHARSCKLTGEVDEDDGLRVGPNRLHASVAAKGGSRFDSQSSDFLYHDSGQVGGAPGSVTYYTPVSVGFGTIPNGGGANGAWVTFTTGETAGVADPVTNFPKLPNPTNPSDPYTPEISYPDTTFSLPNDCSGVYQAIVLKRNEPTIEEASACGNTEPDVESSLATTLGRSLNSTDLVVFGTVPSVFADPTLNTSDLGGTDYTKLPSGSKVFPLYYIIVGVKGAAPGTARENYLTAQTTQTPYTYFPVLGGTLTKDSAGNYNLVSSGEKDFQVISDPQNAMIKFQWGAQWEGQSQWQTYAPPSGAANEFWLIVFDRMAMQPIAGSLFGSGPTSNVDCAYGRSTPQQCGMLFDVHADGGAALAGILSSVSPRNLIVLTSVGCPFDSADQASSSLGDALQNIGGMRYTLDYLNTASATCNYSLVSVNDGKHQWFDSNAAISSNIFSSQGQVGALDGYLGVDHTGLYDVGGKDQMTMVDDVLTPTTNFTFENIASQPRNDWRFTDTPGRLAAYHDISYQLLNSIGVAGPNDYDIRFFYTAIDTGEAVKIAGLASAAQQLANAGKPSPWDTEAEDFSTVASLISIELTQVGNAVGYFAGDDGGGGVRGLMNGTNGQIFTQVSGVANDISKDWKNAQETNVDASNSRWLSLAAGIVSTLGPATALLGPEGPPCAGMIAGALKTGSAALAIEGSTGIPSPEAKYITSLEALAADAGTSQSNMMDQYDGAVDNVMSDYWKFYQAGVMASDTGTGWQIDSLGDGDALANAFVAGERIALWNDILPQLYGARVATSQTSNNPATYGSYVLETNILVCMSAYPNVPSTSMTANHHIGDNQSNLWDVNILSEGLTPPKGNGIDTPVSGDLTNMLTTNQSVPGTGTDTTGLNIPPMMLINNGAWTYSPIKIYNNTKNMLCNATTAPPIYP